jgi:hypothetical protein
VRREWLSHQVDEEVNKNLVFEITFLYHWLDFDNQEWLHNNLNVLMAKNVSGLGCTSHLMKKVIFAFIQHANDVLSSLCSICMFLIGVLGIRLVNGNNEDAHITDAVALIASAISHLFEQQANISGAPNACDETARWDSGTKIFRYLLYYFIFLL